MDGLDGIAHDGHLAAELKSMELSRAIDAVLETYEGETVLARGRVIDDLLDLRLQAEPAAVSLIDTILSSVPGRNLVEEAWARDSLEHLQHVCSTFQPA